jgi:hypothetical protein
MGKGRSKQIFKSAKMEYPAKKVSFDSTTLLRASEIRSEIVFAKLGFT